MAEWDSRGKDGEPLTVEQTFWLCIDEARAQWDFQVEHPDEPKQLAGVALDAYRTRRLTLCLQNILSVAKHMPRPSK